MAGPSLDAKKSQILDAVRSGSTVRDVLEQFSLSESTFYSLRRRDAAWDKQIREVTSMTTGRGKYSPAKPLLFDPDRTVPPKGTFEEWRMRYMGRPSEVFHRAVADAVLDSTNRIVFVLAPPGAGKDTTVGDLLLYLKCDDRDYMRCAWVMENVNFAARRVSERLEPYLSDPKVYRVTPNRTPGGGMPEGSLIDDFGPFRWERGMQYPDGSPVARTTWTQHELRFLQSAAAPEADPDLWATGMEGAVYGSRVQLFVYSDLFTAENQQSPAEKEKQFVWCTGTAESRLDSSGRLVVLGTRVSSDDNYGRMMNHYIGDAEPFDVTQDGPVTVTRYTNGVAVVTCVAIWVDDAGEEQSYSPARFPLDDHWRMPDGTLVAVDDLDVADARARGANRSWGLRRVRSNRPDWFETAYQQNPQESSTLSDFTDSVLERAFAPERTYGKARPSELRIISVDPARTGGAAWVCLAVDVDAETVTVVDERWYTNLGVQGIKRRLIVEPLTLWDPQWLVYETNHEQSVLYDTEIEKAIADFGVTVHRHHTGKNRADPVIGVASLAGLMRKGQLLFPTASPHDKQRSLRLASHFKNWDAAPQHSRSNRQRANAPDDLAMAAWPGVRFAVDVVLERNKRGRMYDPVRPTPESVRRRWERREPPSSGVRKVKHGSYRDTDFVKLFLGEPE